MVPPIQPNSEAVAIEAQIRECYGRVVYSHKAHEKCADLSLAKLSRIKVTQIGLSALTTGGLIAVVLGDVSVSQTAAVIAASLSTILLALNAYMKDVDPGALSQRHKETAHQLWGIRESYLSLLTDMHAGAVTLDQVRARRDELQKQSTEAYAAAPRTTSKGYREASKALKLKEDLTFSDSEIDKFLPAPLHRAAVR